MRGLHVRIEGLSAAFPYPFLKSGTQLSLPVPPLSTILGNLSACAGRVVSPNETKIGIEFRSKTNGKGLDLERTRRLRVDKSGRLRANPEQGLALREFHVRPQLDLYLTALGFKRFLEFPAAVPCLGRSQDIGWIRFVREIDLEQAEAGRLGPTLVPFPNTQVGGQLLPPLVDWYLNDRLGYTRRIGRLSRYQYTPVAEVKRTDDFSIFHPSDSEDPQHVVYLHSLAA